MLERVNKKVQVDYESKIKEILDGFDFETTSCVMNECLLPVWDDDCERIIDRTSWTIGDNTATPSLLKRMASDLLHRVVDERLSSIASGPFKVTRVGDYLSLAFVYCDYDA
jgi:hypothetical protein